MGGVPTTGASSASDSRGRILIADDDPDILGLVKFRLERLGFDVVQATDGQQALDAAAAESFDLAVLDAMMPKLDGYEVVRRLRANEETRTLPVIILSARAQASDVERGLEAGANAYVKKPFASKEFGERVLEVLAQAQGG